MRSTIFIPQQLIFYTLNNASIDARTYTHIYIYMENLKCHDKRVRLFRSLKNS